MNETPELENRTFGEKHLEALQLVDAVLAKNPKNVGFLKQKAALIQLAAGCKYTLRDAEKCLLRAHQLAPRNVDVINDLFRFYDKALPNPERKAYFYNLFCSIVDHKLGLTD
jgi:hypothetical protein